MAGFEGWTIGCRADLRERPGGVAWDAVPLTVRGLNKAAGNPPLKSLSLSSSGTSGLVPLIS